MFQHGHEVQNQQDEITQQQQNLFVARLRELLSPTVPSSGALSEEDLEEMLQGCPDEDTAELIREYKEHSDSIIELDSRSVYQLDGNRIYLAESDTIGAPYHIISLSVTEPAKPIDDNFYGITRRRYEIDLDYNSPSFKEETAVFDRVTRKKVPTPTTALMSLDGSPEDFKRWAQELAEQEKLADVMGLDLFTHERFSEAMRILEQLGADNRIE